MRHNHTAIYVHCIFATKERASLIPANLQPRLWAYLGGVARNLGFHVIMAGGTANHVHLLIAVPPIITVAEAIQKLKANSSRWLHEQHLLFEWQAGYGAFSVSPSLIGDVKKYIANQSEHHKRRDFQAEFEAFLRKSGIMLDASAVPEGT